MNEKPTLSDGLRRRRPAMRGWGAALVLVCCATAWGQALDGAPLGQGQASGRIVRVGLSGVGSSWVREGSWSFVEVELAWQGPAPLSGVVEVQHLDRDGDVARHRSSVVLSPGGGARRASVYFVPNLRRSGDVVQVRLLDERGRAIRLSDDKGERKTSLQSRALTPLPTDAGLIVDLSSPPIGLLGYQRASAEEDVAGVVARESRWRVLREDASALPERWLGLEAVDVIVWDDPDPTTLSTEQLGAVVDWVRYGGRLVFSAGRNWQAIRQSRLADVLPVRIQGVRRAFEVQEFSQSLMRDDAFDFEAWYARNPLTRCRMTPLPDAMPVPSNPADLRGLEPIVYRLPVGRGMVTFVGAPLRELLAPVRLPADILDQTDPPNADEDQVLRVQRLLWEQLLGVSARREPVKAWLTDVDLFAFVRGTIGFQAAGAYYLLFAVLFALAYTFSATLGSFWWLRRRNVLQHCWTVLSIFAVGGSVLGTLAVWWLRGVTTQLEQTTVVDGHANSGLAVAYAMFGVRTPTHTRLNVRIPVVGISEGHEESALGSVRVVPEDLIASTEAGFVAPESYVVRSAGAVLEDMPVRATVKELEGYWEGVLQGRLEAKIVMSRVPTAGGRGHVERFMSGTFIRNRLGFDLEDCFLLETSMETAVRAPVVRCYALGPLRAEGPGSELDERSMRRFFFKGTVSEPTAESEEKGPGEIEHVQDYMKRWCAPFIHGPLGFGRGPETPVGRAAWRGAVPALLMLSMMDLYWREETHPQQDVRLYRTHGRRLDCTHLLTRGTAVLIGFSEAPAPIGLRVNGETLNPTRARTMYRFVIPVTRM